MSECKIARAQTDDARRLTVLLVEKSEVLRDRLLALLRSIPGTSVVDTDGAAGALAFLGRHQADVAVLDIDLPGWPDLEDLARVRLAMGSATVIVLASDPSPESVAFCRRVGADFVFHTHSEFYRIGDVLLQLLTQLATPPAPPASPPITKESPP
jgi:DNA-binding NarL/FixJ family response regulator